MFTNKNLDKYTYIGNFRGMTIYQDKNGNIAIGGTDKMEFFKSNSVVRDLVGLIIAGARFSTTMPRYK